MVFMIKGVKNRLCVFFSRACQPPGKTTLEFGGVAQAGLHRSSRMRSLVGAAAFALTTSALPCDTYAAAGTPCVGAFSLLRALRAGFGGPLYYVRRASDNTTAAVPLLSAGGFVNASVQEEFCAGTSCVVWRLVDQSLYNNDLTPAPPGGSARHVDNGVDASALPVRMPDGSRAYGALFVHGANQGYRIDITNGVAVCVRAFAPRPRPKALNPPPPSPRSQRQRGGDHLHGYLRRALQPRVSSDANRQNHAPQKQPKPSPKPYHPLSPFEAAVRFRPAKAKTPRRAKNPTS